MLAIKVAPIPTYEQLLSGVANMLSVLLLLHSSTVIEVI